MTMPILLFTLLLMVFCGQQFCHAEDTDYHSSLPVVPDPKFPILPQEFLSQVDQSCQNAAYMGGHMVANISDYHTMAIFGGCKPLSQGYCQGIFGQFGLDNNSIVVYKRSWTGVWIAFGFKQEHSPICTHPDPPTLLLRKFIEKAGWPSLSLKPYVSAKNEGLEEPLPRIADMPLPAPWPPVLVNGYKEVCRVYEGQWNVNFAKQTEQQFYTNCNFTSDSGQYCKKPRRKNFFATAQKLILRSNTGGYEVSGYKWRGNPDCRLPS